MSDFTQYFAIEKKLKSQGYDIDRSDVIKQFSNGKKAGLKQLTYFEYNELLRWLNSKFLTSKPAKEQFFDSAENLQRRKIIALFAKIGYTKDGKADIYRINGWAMSHGHLNKKMNDYHGADLAKLVFQAEQVYKTYIEAQ